MTFTTITFRAGRRTIRFERFHESTADAHAWFDRTADDLAIDYGVKHVTLVSIE